jgi:hypothetical protein
MHSEILCSLKWAINHACQMNVLRNKHFKDPFSSENILEAASFFYTNTSRHTSDRNDAAKV